MKKCVALLALMMAATGCVPQAGGGGAPAPQPARQWPVLTRKHVDLWLHGYAMLLRDTATIPVFRKGYRQKIEALKAQRGLKTMLDANREALQTRLANNPALFNGQFAPMYFASFEQMRDVIRAFVGAGGNVRGTNDPTLAQYFAVLAQSFPNAGDRDWLRLFTESLDDERRQFYDAYWNSENLAHVGVVRATDSLWQAEYRDKLRRFLNNTQQETGDLILALTLGGEGRTVNFSSRQNAVAVTWPEAEPREAFYVFAHEIVGGVVAASVNDNITPTEQRSGIGAAYITTGAVRAGAMLLDRTAKDLVPGYMRYYLGLAGVSTSGDISARFASKFQLPDLILKAIERQLDVILGGI